MISNFEVFIFFFWYTWLCDDVVFSKFNLFQEFLVNTRTQNLQANGSRKQISTSKMTQTPINQGCKEIKRPKKYEKTKKAVKRRHGYRHSIKEKETRWALAVCKKEQRKEQRKQQEKIEKKKRLQEREKKRKQE